MVQDSPWACNRILLLKEIERRNTLSSFRDFHPVKWFTEDEEKDDHTHPIDPIAILQATARISKFTLKFGHLSTLSLLRGSTGQCGRPLKMSGELMMLHERVISPDTTFPIESLGWTIAFKGHFSSWPYSLKSSLLNRHISCVRSSHSLYWILDLLTLKCSSTVIGWRWKVASLLCLGWALCIL